MILQEILREQHVDGTTVDIMENENLGTFCARILVNEEAVFSDDFPNHELAQQWADSYLEMIGLTPTPVGY